MPAQRTGRLAAALLLSLSILATPALAGPLTPGNVVVYRVGSGTGSLVATGTPVFLDEYTPAGTKVQSIAMPTAAVGAQKALVASGTADVDGLMTRSADGNCLIVPGYGRDLGTGTGNLVTTGVTASGGAIPRVVARVTGLGVIDTSTALTDASLQTNFRGATSSDCSNLWVSGVAGTSGSAVRYTTIGSTTSVNLIGTALLNARAVAVFGGQLYVTTSVTALRTVGTVGTGTPTSGPQVVTKIMDFAATAQPWAFFFARLNPASPDFDTLYIADEVAGLQKWSLVGGAWVLNGAVGGASDLYHGVTGTMNGTTVTLFATRKGGTTATGGGELVSIVDASGYNGAFSATPTLLATAATNTAFRSVAPTPGTVTQVPSYTVTPSAGDNGTISPNAPQAVFSGASVSFTVQAAFGYMPAMGGTCGGALNGTQYTTNPVNANCTVEASFVPLPRYTVTPTATANGAVSPASLEIMQGQTGSFEVTPAPGYNAAVRGTCGGSFTGNTWTTKPVTGNCTIAVTFAKKLVLFVGNSYTFGRADPVMSYNTANVTDLTLDMWIANPAGSNEDEPHPWGGIPGVFKKMTDQAGLEYDVSISARNAASLRGHYLNSNPAGWDLRSNIASQRFDVVMLQDLSDEPLPTARSSNANLPYFNAYVDKIEAWVHAGNAETFTETQLFGGTTATCQAITGASASACNTVRSVPTPNPHARAGAEVYLYQTWARPDMIAPNGSKAEGTTYTAAEGLETMTAELHDAYFQRAVANGRIEDVSAVGDAFLRAVTDGVAMRDPYVPEPGKVNLWWTDYFHPSKYGSYLSAAVHFMTITGINPLTLGPNEQAAADLGIEPDVAKQLQRVAQAVVSPDTIAPVASAVRSIEPNAAGWTRDDVTVTFTATDTGGSLLDFIRYTLAGAQAGSGDLANGGAVTITAEGVTTVTYYAVDRAGNAEVARTLTVRIDRTAPTIAGMPAATCNLWPPNLKMVTVATISSSDPVSGVASFEATASSSEAPVVAGQVDTQVTGSGTNPRTVSLRAARLGTDDRIYTITATATDAAGNTAAAVATCVVPRNQ